MRRREFMTLLGGAVTAWPLAARAQQPALPVIGYLGQTSAEAYAGRLKAFRQGLGDMGYVESRNVTIEYRWEDNDNSRLPDLAADLVRRQVRVIVGGPPQAAAAKAATKTIPIVFTGAPDPVQIGFVASLSRPGGNLTGITSMGTEIGGKQLGLMHELLPSATHFGLLANPNGLVFGGPMAKDMQAAAQALGGRIEVFSAGTVNEIDSAFASLTEKRVEALFVSPSIFFTSRRLQFATLAARHAVPTVYNDRGYVEVGGLMSYGTSGAEIERQAGVYAGRILRGEKPADLPVFRASRFELVINLQTAKTLGITLPPGLLASADEVIE
jgi:putative ABC transport system substrate-binding protein